MYWSRTGNPVDLLLFALLCLCWATGGWLLAVQLFRLRPAERLLSGLAAGFVLFIALGNLLAHLLPLSLAFWTAALLLLASGLAVAWVSPNRPRFPGEDLHSWPQLAGLAGLTLVFTLIGRGLALFDDYLHLPLVSIMGAGDIPPHFYLNPAQPFSYHYGLQIFAASLVRLAGFFPWSAWDLSKAWAIALTFVLAWIWFRGVTGSQGAATAGSFLINFASGARWLLLLLPLSLLARISSRVDLINTGADSGANLLEVLSRPWIIEGGGPYPFPFAFHNSMFVPVFFNLGSSGALPFLTVILLLILARERRDGDRHFSFPSLLLVSLIFASLALSAEHLFVFLWAGIALAVWLTLQQSRARGESLAREAWIAWGVILLVSAVLSLVQGAFLTEAFRALVLGLEGVERIARNDYNYFSFGLRWPPALVSGHFGTLSLFNPGQFLVLLAELGPAILFAPAATVFSWRSLRRNDYLQAGLGLAAGLIFLSALVFRYGIERSTTRLPATALWIWALLGFPLLWQAYQSGKPVQRLLFQVLYILIVFSGLVIFAVQLTAIPAPQLTYFANANEARLSAELWDRLPLEAQVLDRIPFRAVTLFGRATRAHLDIYQSLPEWDALVADPNPQTIAQAGYWFIYLDDTWWWEMRPEQRETFLDPCVQLFAEQNPAGEEFYRLLDVRSCKQ